MIIFGILFPIYFAFSTRQKNGKFYTSLRSTIGLGALILLINSCNVREYFQSDGYETGIFTIKGYHYFIDKDLSVYKSTNPWIGFTGIVKTESGSYTATNRSCDSIFGKMHPQDYEKFNCKPYIGLKIPVLFAKEPNTNVGIVIGDLDNTSKPDVLAYKKASLENSVYVTLFAFIPTILFLIWQVFIFTIKKSFFTLTRRKEI